MNSVGHNENAVRLAALAGDAQIALNRVAKGEADATAGWLAYGAALNEGRALCPGDKEFGQWLRSSKLEEDVHPADQSAAMWAAANRDQYEAVCAENPKVRTVRGAHKKHLEAEAEREKERVEAERKAKAEEERRAREAAAEAAKADAEAKAAAEEEARKAAAAAKDEAERQAAEARAAEAAEAFKVAKEQAEAAEKAAAPDPEPDPDPYAAERKALAKLTRQGIEDELIETRIALADWKEKHRKLRKERDGLKEQIADLKEIIDNITEQGSSETISGLRSRAFRANEAFKDIKAEKAKEMRRANFFEDKCKKLEKEVAALKENQEFTL